MSVQLVSKISNLCDPDPPTLQTDRRTDGRTTCNLNTALCTSASRGKNARIQLSTAWPIRYTLVVKTAGYRCCISICRMICVQDQMAILIAVLPWLKRSSVHDDDDKLGNNVYYATLQCQPATMSWDTGRQTAAKNSIRLHYSR